MNVVNDMLRNLQQRGADDVASGTLVVAEGARGKSGFTAVHYLLAGLVASALFGVAMILVLRPQSAVVGGGSVIDAMPTIGPNPPASNSQPSNPPPSNQLALNQPAVGRRLLVETTVPEVAAAPATHSPWVVPLEDSINARVHPGAHDPARDPIGNNTPNNIRPGSSDIISDSDDLVDGPELVAPVVGEASSESLLIVNSEYVVEPLLNWLPLTRTPLRTAPGLPPILDFAALPTVEVADSNQVEVPELPVVDEVGLKQVAPGHAAPEAPAGQATLNQPENFLPVAESLPEPSAALEVPSVPPVATLLATEATVELADSNSEFDRLLSIVKPNESLTWRQVLLTKAENGQVSRNMYDQGAIAPVSLLNSELLWQRSATVAKNAKRNANAGKSQAKKGSDSLASVLSIRSGASVGGVKQNSSVYGESMRALARGNELKAKELLHQVLADDPGDVEARRQLAGLYLQSEDFGAVEQLLASTPAAQQSEPAIALIAAHLRLAKGQKSAALSLLRQNFPAISKNIDYYSLKASLLFELEEYSEARILYQQLLIYRPDSARLAMGYGFSLKRDGFPGDAKTAFNRALSGVNLDKTSRYLVLEELRSLVEN